MRCARPRQRRRSGPRIGRRRRRSGRRGTRHGLARRSDGRPYGHRVSRFGTVEGGYYRVMLSTVQTAASISPGWEALLFAVAIALFLLVAFGAKIFPNVNKTALGLAFFGLVFFLRALSAT